MKQSGQQDNIPTPITAEADALRSEAVDGLVSGRTTIDKVAGNDVIRVKGAAGQDDRFVQYDVDRRAKMFTILAEFGTATSEATGGNPGPLHNAIKEPDRVIDGSPTDDNTTVWTKDFNQAYYQNVMFGPKNSMRDFYHEQSQGRFDVTGDVSDWVKLPFNEAKYGSNKQAYPSLGYWSFIHDAGNAWFNAQKAAGKSDAEIKQYLAQFDVYDRYDFDQDGNFNEPDGYIDHFQAIHAGGGEESDRTAEGEDAIWSHRSYAFTVLKGKEGPESFKNGGTQIGNTGLWIGDYITMPENGGVGSVAHEFGHDLGLKDLYDTSAKGSASNGVAYWSLMNAGSWLSEYGHGVASTPGGFGAYDRLLLGWLNLATTEVGKDARLKLGPAAQDRRGTNQAVLVRLPDQESLGQMNRPWLGKQWWSGNSENLDATLSTSIDLTAATRSASIYGYLQWETEADKDVWTVEVSTDGGKTWVVLGDPKSGTDMIWKKYEWDLTPYLGKKIDFRFHYVTDAAVTKRGLFIDSITVRADDFPIDLEGADSDDTRWTAKGFTRNDGNGIVRKPHYYLAENRQHVGYDEALRYGPYNFGFGRNPNKPEDQGRPNMAEFFSYDEGMVVWYINPAYKDNNSSQHPGYGVALPVDARPYPMMWDTVGRPMSNKIQTKDAAFGLKPTRMLGLHLYSEQNWVSPGDPKPVFDDKSTTAYYWDEDSTMKYNSTKTAGSGVKIEVKGEKNRVLDVQVTYPKK